MRKSSIQPGQRFGKLVTVEVVGHGRPHGRLWLLKCDCGNTQKTSSARLNNNHVRSCGCLVAESIRAAKITHNMTKTPEYRCWSHIKSRCYNPRTPDYKNYMDRGIRMCDEWKNSFETFFSDMGKRPTTKHTIERVDNNGLYEKLNCVWATRLVQNANRRNTHLLTFRGETMTKRQWALRLGIGYATVQYRLKAGWSVERTLTQRVQ
jgi:hypothetical protein